MWKTFSFRGLDKVFFLAIIEYRENKKKKVKIKEREEIKEL
jgi:hypothetical protein